MDAIKAANGWMTASMTPRNATIILLVVTDRTDAEEFYSLGKLSSCRNRWFVEVTPDRTTPLWIVADVVNDNGMPCSSAVQEGGDGWTRQRALTARNNVTIDIVACAYSQPDFGGDWHR